MVMNNAVNPKLETALAEIQFGNSYTLQRSESELSEFLKGEPRVEFWSWPKRRSLI